MKKKKESVWISGLPIQSSIKVLLTISFFIVAVFNYVLLRAYSITYPFQGFVSLIMIIAAVVFSYGSKISEFFIIAIAIIAIMNNTWEMFMGENSLFRLQVMYAGFIIIFLELALGRISPLGFINFMKRTFGLIK